MTSYLAENAAQPGRRSSKLVPDALIHGYHVSFFWGAVLLFCGLLVAIFVINAKKQDVPTEPGVSAAV